MAIFSPFRATEGLPFYGAWAYWTGLIAWGWIIASLITGHIQQKMRLLPVFWFYFSVSILMAALVLPAILLVQWFIGDPIQLSYTPSLFGLVWVVSAAITTITWLIEKAHSAPQTAGQSAFLARIPAKLSGGDLYAVSSEDHYLRIHTELGSDLILMRLGDALQELSGVDGMQVHRSWWVARHGVADIKRDAARIILCLRDGTEVPVSRTYAPKIRKAGWMG